MWYVLYILSVNLFVNLCTIELEVDSVCNMPHFPDLLLTYIGKSIPMLKNTYICVKTDNHHPTNGTELLAEHT